jgi:hypothetical protein
MDNLHIKKRGRPQNNKKTCECCNKEFATTKQKCTHEFKMKSKKAKTEVGSVLGDGDDFGISLKVGPPTSKALK